LAGPVLPALNLHSPNPDNPLAPRMSKREVVAFVSRYGIPPTSVPLSIELPMVVGSAPVVLPANHIALTPIGDGVNPNTDGLYFDTPIKVYMYYLSESIVKLRQLSTQMNNSLDNDSLENVYNEHIPRIILECLNISLLLMTLTGELPMVNKHFSELKDFFEKSKPHLQTNTRFLCEQINDELSLVLSNTEKVDGNFDNIYAQIKNLVGYANSAVSLIEMISAQRCIIAYYNSNTFESFYSSPRTLPINKIINKPMQTLKEIPGTLVDFIKLASKDSYLTKNK
jgi:hypothetical protein